VRQWQYIIRDLFTISIFCQDKAKIVEKAQFTRVNEHSKTIFNAVMAKKTTRAKVSIIVLLLTLSAHAYAHKPSDSFLSIEQQSDQIFIRWAIALRDLDVALGIDSNNDGKIQWRELRSHENTINSYALSRLALSANEENCSLSPLPLQVENKSDGAYASLNFIATCRNSGQALTIDYRLLFDIDPSHRGLISYTRSGQTIARVASPESSQIILAISKQNQFGVFSDYLKEGMWHIWIGFDHILFLLTLLLPAVLVYRQRQWQAVTHMRPAVIDTIKIITAFTIAHSITLSLAVFKIVTLPSQIVESVIALSVLLIALNNLRPLFSSSRWLLAFVFGLVHGFGFASVLADLGLPANALVVALFGFNVGVEFGQLAIVLLVLPMAMLIRDKKFYQMVIFKGGSITAALVATVWMFERVFDYQILTI